MQEYHLKIMINLLNISIRILNLILLSNIPLLDNILGLFIKNRSSIHQKLMISFLILITNIPCGLDSLPQELLSKDLSKILVDICKLFEGIFHNSKCQELYQQ